MRAVWEDPAFVVRFWKKVQIADPAFGGGGESRSTVEWLLRRAWRKPWTRAPGPPPSCWHVTDATIQGAAILHIYGGAPTPIICGTPRPRKGFQLSAYKPANAATLSPPDDV
jgi:hypothetical protein